METLLVVIIEVLLIGGIAYTYSKPWGKWESFKKNGPSSLLLQPCVMFLAVFLRAYLFLPEIKDNSFQESEFLWAISIVFISGFLTSIGLVFFFPLTLYEDDKPI